MHGIFAMYVKLFRDITHPVVEFLPNLFGVHPPLVVKDLWTLSAVITSCAFRSVGKTVVSCNGAITLLFLKYSCLGFFIPALYGALVFGLAYRGELRGEARIVAVAYSIGEVGKFLGQIGVAVGGSLLYFLFNAFVGFTG